MALALSVPVQEKNSLKGLEIRPKQAKAWIESLPLTRTLESARASGYWLASADLVQDLEGCAFNVTGSSFGDRMCTRTSATRYADPAIMNTGM